MIFSTWNIKIIMKENLKFLDKKVCNKNQMKKNLLRQISFSRFPGVSSKPEFSSCYIFSNLLDLNHKCNVISNPLDLWYVHYCCTLYIYIYIYIYTYLCQLTESTQWPNLIKLLLITFLTFCFINFCVWLIN